MIKVFKHIDQYDASKGEFFNWSYTTVRNAALTLLRDQKTKHFGYEEINESMFFEAKENPFQELEYQGHSGLSEPITTGDPPGMQPVLS